MRRALVPLLLLTAACASTPTSDSRAQVLASAYPFAWATEQVAGADAHVVDLVRGGGEPHDVELAPRQVGAVEKADVVVYLRGFQPAVDEAVRATGAPGALDLRGPTDAQPPTSALTEGSRSGIDPHVWLDPVRMEAVVRAVRDRLTQVDPTHAPAYAARADRAIASLAELDQLFRSQLRECARHEIVTAHTAFAYLAQRYGLQQVGISGIDPESEPTPGRVAAVASLARRLGVTTVFFGSAASPGLASTVAAEVGARTSVLDPIEGVAAGDDYLSVMRRNALALHDGLGCA